MENLIKPVDYAAKMGISRQAVYAKIKKGLLPSKNVGGKIYVIETVEDAQERNDPSTAKKPDETQKLLEAKDETISVLKETIRDLKETNRMITTTLRSEVELLKEAFGEMKSLYAAQIEHVRESESIPVAELAETPEIEEENSPAVPAEAPEKIKDTHDETEWLSLEDFLKEQGIQNKKLRKEAKKATKRLLEKEKKGVRREGEALLLTPKRAVAVLKKILKR